MKKALWIGRFQPFHLGHLSAVKQIRKDGVEKLIIGVGSAQEKHTLKNPFTYEERKELISRTLNENITLEYNIIPIPDFNNDEQWKKYILQKLSKKKQTKGWSDYEIETDYGFDAVYSGNPWVKSIFENMNVKDIDETKVPISGSNIRTMIADNENLESLMSKSAIEYLNEIDAIKRLRDLTPKPRNPYLATDAIIEINNSIVLVKRKNEPKKYALPGGFVEYGESAENAAIREAKEETNIDFKITNLLGFYSNPKRDPRNHIASAVYYGRGNGELKKNEESENVILVSPSIAAHYMDLAFDHNKILKDYLMLKY